VQFTYDLRDTIQKVETGKKDKTDCLQLNAFVYDIMLLYPLYKNNMTFNKVISTTTIRCRNLIYEGAC